MKTYDKAKWHIDGGENEKEVIGRFKEVFKFLHEKKLLSEDGEETLEYGMDSSVSLNSAMVNRNGKKFLDLYYDVILGKNPKETRKNLLIYYREFEA